MTEQNKSVLLCVLEDLRRENDVDFLQEIEEANNDPRFANTELPDKLRAIILKETAKDYKDMDSDLVTECVDFLSKLEGKTSAAHREESRARLMSALDERR